MKRERLFSATEIAEIIGEVDNLGPEDQETTHNRIRYLTKRTYRNEAGAELPLLQDGEQIDARGKRAYPLREVYRTAIFNDLMSLAIDVRALQAVVDAASRETPLSHLATNERPASLRVDGGWKSHGGLVDAVRGVSQGEQWTLVLAYKHGGHSRDGRIAAWFVPDSKSWAEAQAETDSIYGARRIRTVLQIDLAELFGPIIEQVGAI